MTCVVVFVLMVVFIGDKLNSDNQVNDLLFENIECLASSENPDVSCFYIGSLDCPLLNVKVLYFV